MMGLTPMQARVVRAIEELTRDNVAPSYEEIRQEVGLANRSRVHRLLHLLRERGAVAFDPYRKRSVRVIGAMEGLGDRTTEDLRALRDRIDAILKERAK